MPYTRQYTPETLSREEFDALPGTLLVEFGTQWCGFCTTAQPAIEAALAKHSGVHHIKVEDGKGRPLGRSFRVKLWPTLVLVRDGVELGRVVRPDSREDVEQLLASG